MSDRLFKCADYSDKCDFDIANNLCKTRVQQPVSVVADADKDGIIDKSEVKKVEDVAQEVLSCDQAYIQNVCTGRLDCQLDATTSSCLAKVLSGTIGDEDKDNLIDKSEADKIRDLAQDIKDCAKITVPPACASNQDCQWEANSCLTKVEVVVEIPASIPPTGTPPGAQPLTCSPRASAATYNNLDFNGDNGVDIQIIGTESFGSDGLLFNSHFNTNSQSANWDVRYDLNGDCKVDFDDFFLLVDLLGQPPEVTVANKAPEASFETIQGYRVGLALSFDASASKDDDGTIASYKWNFGDNTPEQTVQIPQTSHVYTAHGNYVVTLIITDDDGSTASVQKGVRIDSGAGSVPPIPLSVDFDYQSSAFVGEEITFTGSAEDIAPPIEELTGITYEWDFGDDSAKSTANPARHAYTVKGTYNIKVIAIKDAFRGEVTKTVTINEKQVGPANQDLAIPTDVSLSYTPSENRVIIKWKDVANAVTVDNGRNDIISYAISRESESVRDDNFALNLRNICNDQECTYTDEVGIRAGANYLYRIKATKGTLESLYTTVVQINIPASCSASQGDGCTALLQAGETEIVAGNGYCSLVNSGKCVKCGAGFTWDEASKNCLAIALKANGETCASSNECVSRLCGVEGKCSELTLTELQRYDLNSDNCVDREDYLALEILLNAGEADVQRPDYNGDGALSSWDVLSLADRVGLGDACPIVPADFDNTRCVNNADKVMLQIEIAKPTAQRSLKFDVNGDNKVDGNDLTAFRGKFRNGARCNPLTKPIGDVDGNYCIEDADVDRVVSAKNAAVITAEAISQNDFNKDSVLDDNDVDVVRRSLGQGDNCPVVVIRWGDFNGDKVVEITGTAVGELGGADGELFQSHYGSKQGDVNWDHKYDFDKNKAVNLDDFFRLMENFKVIEETINYNNAEETRANLVESNIRLDIRSGDVIQTQINGKYREFNPYNKDPANKLGLNSAALTSTVDLTGKMQKMLISIAYTDADIQRLGIAEANLKMYYYNPATSDWEAITTTVDTENNLVTGETNHFSDYGIFGDKLSAPPADSGASSGGSSGGGRRTSGSSSCPTVRIENAAGDCKRACQSSISVWQNKGYNVVDECSVGEPQQPVSPLAGGEDYPTIDDYERAGISRNDADSDNDGILDDLEIQFFGDLTQGFDDDYDNDGAVNGKEINVDKTNPIDPNDFLVDEEGNAGIIIGVIVIIILGGGIGTLVWMRRQEKLGRVFSSSAKQGKQPLTNQEKKIVTYIKEARAAGMKDSEIKSSLIKSGWKGAQVENAFSSLR